MMYENCKPPDCKCIVTFINSETGEIMPSKVEKKSWINGKWVVTGTFEPILNECPEVHDN